MAINRRKRPLVRTVETRDATLIVVATEGEKTEKIYFDRFRNSRVKIQTIPSQDGESSPEHVLTNIETFRKRFDLDDGDELWLVIDTDRWPEKNLSAVASACVSKRFNLAASNPCFELWLALHCDQEITDDVSSSALRKHLVSFLGSFNKSKYDADKLISGLRKAIQRARLLEQGKGGRWPERPGTHIFRIFDRYPFVDSQNRT